jgi:hypothetical protein
VLAPVSTGQISVSKWCTAMKFQPEQIKSATPVDISAFNSPVPIAIPGNDPGAEKPFVAPRVLIFFIRVMEVCAIAAVAVAGLWLYPGFSHATPGLFYATLISAVALAVPTAAQLGGLYRLDMLLNPLRSTPGLASAWIGIFAAVAISVLATKMGHELSRAWFISWGVSGLGWLILGRVAIAGVIRHLNARGQLNRRAVIVGGGSDAEQAVAALQHSHDTGITLVGMFDDRNDDRSPGETRGLRKLGNIEDLVSFVRTSRVDTLIVTLPTTAELRLMEIVSRLWVLPVDIRLSAYSQKLHTARAPTPTSATFRSSMSSTSRWATGTRSSRRWKTRSSPPSPSSCWRPSCCSWRSPSGSTARGRCCSSRSAMASTTS